MAEAIAGEPAQQRCALEPRRDGATVRLAIGQWARKESAVFA
jgi:hypothetical protein